MDLCILAVLQEGENYGYEISQRLQQLESLAFGESTLYPALTRLRKRKWITARSVPSPSGPPRRYFRLTPDGRSALAEMKRYWRGLVADVDALMDASEVER